MENILDKIDSYKDCEVWPRDVLDSEIADQCPTPFFLQYEAGRVENFLTEEAACRQQRRFRIQNDRDPMTGKRGRYVKITVRVEQGPRGPYEDRTIHSGFSHGCSMIMADRDENHGSRGYWETVAGYSLGQTVKTPDFFGCDAVILAFADDGERCWVSTGPRTAEFELWDIMPETEEASCES